MRTLLLVAGLATGVALLSGALLLASGPGRGAATGGTGEPSARGGAAARETPPPAPVPPAVDRRLRDLEAELEEVRARLDLLAAGGSLAPAAHPGTPALPGGAAGLFEGEAPDPGDSPGEEETAAGGEPATVEERLRALGSRNAELRDRLRDLRREAEIANKVEVAAEAMELQPFEKARLEEIVRGHVQKVDELAGRAREMFKDSPFGLTPGDRSLVEQMEGDRKRLDRETEQALVTLVGAERWKEYRKAVKAQQGKERALRRLGQPW